MKNIDLTVLGITIVMLFAFSSCNNNKAKNMDNKEVVTERIEQNIIANTKNGKVRGKQLDNGIIQFASIPFAEAPTGALRYLPPQPVKNWKDTLDATHLRSRAMQLNNVGMDDWDGGMSEDCLWLKISTPAIDTKKRPVLVFNHGGGYHSGGAGEHQYEGKYIAKRGDVVQVNIQYRLGLFGWMDLSELGDERLKNSGNNGQMDQLMALKWVKENIENFGGDPNNITIYGESAGSFGIAGLSQLPEAQPYFNKFILMSGVYQPGYNAIDKRKIAKKYMEILGAKTLSDLQEFSSTELLDAQLKLSDYATKELGSPDLQVLIQPNAPSLAMVKKNAQEYKKPLLHGTTANEYHLFQRFYPDKKEKQKNMAYDYLMTLGLTQNQVTQLLDIVIKGSPNVSKEDAYINAITASYMFYPHKKFANAQQSADIPVYQYVFDWTSPVFPELGAFHTIDLSFAFATLKEGENFVGENPPKQLANDFMDAFIAFARTGDPNTKTLPNWPVYNETTKPIMKFGTPTELIENPYPWMEEFSNKMDKFLNNN